MSAPHTFAASCATCHAGRREYCEYAFGRYWSAKSHGGVGCDQPLTWVTRRHVAAMEEAKTVSHTASQTVSQDVMPKIAATGVWHKWLVRHKGQDFQTAAKSEAEAVNFIRFKLYGTTPLDRLPPFAARLADEQTTHTDAKTGSARTLAPDLVRQRLARLAAR